MDFRLAPSAPELTWLAPRGFGKTKTAAATYNGKKIVVQTPPCPTRMFKDAGSKTLYMRLDESEVHREFAAWIESYEAHAAPLHEVEMSPSLRNGSFRLMVWDDAQWFDAAGTFLKDPPAVVEKCTCIMEFGGCWVSASKWGLKWRVTQVQLQDPAGPGDAPPPPKYGFIDDA